METYHDGESTYHDPLKRRNENRNRNKGEDATNANKNSVKPTSERRHSNALFTRCEDSLVEPEQNFKCADDRTGVQGRFSDRNRRDNANLNIVSRIPENYLHKMNIPMRPGVPCWFEDSTGYST